MCKAQLAINSPLLKIIGGVLYINYSIVNSRTHLVDKLI
jgi:hypothetical protein